MKRNVRLLIAQRNYDSVLFYRPDGGHLSSSDVARMLQAVKQKYGQRVSLRKKLA